MRYLLDTNVCVDFLNRRFPSVTERIQSFQPEDLCLSSVVVAELRAEDVLREFLQGWIALGWRVWSVGEDLLGARWGMWVAWRET